MTENFEISSLYPPPPPYYKFFTPSNVQKYNTLRKDGISDEEISQLHDLKFLVHPQHPEKEQYRSFGDLWWFEDKQIGLKESGIEQIYGDKDETTDTTSNSKKMNNDTNDEKEEDEMFTKLRIDELKKMTKSLLLNFLELVGIISKNPKLASKKIDNIRTILINIHHLLNSYRSHQSRETLILSLQKKLTETQENVLSIKNTCAQVESKLNLLEQKLANLQSSKLQKESDKKSFESNKKIYSVSESLRKEAIDAILKS